MSANRELDFLDALKTRLQQISLANGYQHDLAGPVNVHGVDVFDPKAEGETIIVVPDDVSALAERKNNTAASAMMSERDIGITWFFQAASLDQKFAEAIPRINDLKRATLRRGNDADYAAAGASVVFAGSDIDQPKDSAVITARLVITVTIVEKFT